MECKKCGSTNTVKNGRTATGQQQYHCRECGVYTVTDDRARARAIKMDIVDKLHRERVSQRGSVSVKVLPTPGVLVTAMLPPRSPGAASPAGAPLRDPLRLR
jgi:hypothetical protein